jgi:cellulose synthase/poly-beta-1,6-N-acetylglucosamine synthase-like glycosyltransferase
VILSTTIQETLMLLLWSSVGGVLIAYVVYPLLIWLLSLFFGGRKSDCPTLRADQLPAVSLLISAHDEESCIEDRIQNALATDYPSDKLEICIASDGSVDRTNEIVSGLPERNVRLLAYDLRRGKAATLNSSICQIEGDIVIFSDANTLFEPTAIARLVRWFADPSVGVVCGKLVLTDSKTGRNVDGLYWHYETFLKQCEGKLGGLLGANGAIYAMRRALYQPIPDNTIIDDFVIPLFAKLKHPFRIVYDATAIAHEETAPTIGHEFWRRVRIGSGDYQSLLLLWPLLNPRHGWTTFTFVGHKLLRWLSPFFLLTAIASNIFLLPRPFYMVTLLIQLAFYTTALIGIWAVGDNRGTKLLRCATLFCSVNAALLMGFFRWATTVQTGMWQRTDREVDPA